MADKRRRPRSAAPGKTDGDSRHAFLEDLSQALARLAEASDRLRQRRDQVDQFEQPARWSAINDQIRGLDERISGLRDEQQRVSMSATELVPLPRTDLDALRSAIATLSQLVRAASTASAVAEAAGTLAAVATEAIRKSRPQG